jgi:hypothetical protein
MDFSDFKSFSYQEIKDIIYLIGISTESDFG